MSFSTRLIASLILIVCAGSLGCSTRSWGVGSHSDGGSKDGVTFDYTIEHLTCDGRVYLVLAADGCDGARTNSGPNAQGQLAAIDKRRLAWSCTTKDGTGGTVVIDGQQFDLAKGAVFLISAKENTTKVEQMAVDLSRLQGGLVHEKLRGLADTEPRIAAFFKAAGGAK